MTTRMKNGVMLRNKIDTQDVEAFGTVPTFVLLF